MKEERSIEIVPLAFFKFYFAIPISLSSRNSMQKLESNVFVNFAAIKYKGLLQFSSSRVSLTSSSRRRRR